MFHVKHYSRIMFHVKHWLKMVGDEKMGNESTTKIDIDISGLKKNIQEANRLMRVANSEFKATSATMGDWAKSADGISAKLTQLNKVSEQQKVVLNSLEQQYAAVVAEEGATSKGAQELEIKINNQKAAIGRTNSEIAKWEQSLASVTAEQKATATASDKLKATIAGQESELTSLKQKYTDLALTQGENSQEAKNTAAAISKLSGELSNNKKKLSDAEKAADGLGNELGTIGDSAKKAESGFTVLKGALASLIADGIKTAVGALKDLTTELLTDSSNAYAQFAAATGTATSAMGEYETAIKNVYKNNFGESLEDVAQKMAKVKEVTGELDATKLQEMTEKAMTLEDTFDMDMSETLRGVNSLMSHFGLTSSEAFDLISSGAQNGLNYTDELGDNVAEYSGKFAEAGYSSKEYFQLLQNGSQGGAYNLDKVNDAINEVTTRMADGTIEDNIKGFSKGTQELFKSWQNGGASQKEVITSIVNDIKNTKGEQEKMNLAALAFGTMAEDGGTKFIEALTPVGDTFKDVKGKADELAQMKYDTPQAAIQGIGRTLKVDLLEPMVQKLMPYLNDAAAWVTENIPAFKDELKEVGDNVSSIISFTKALTPVLVGVGTAIAGLALVGLIQNIGAVGAALEAWAMQTKLVTAAQWLLNAAMNANPISLIIIAIAALVAAFVVLWNKSEAFRKFWIDLWEKIKSAAKVAIDAVSKFFSDAWGAIKNVWSGAKAFFESVWAAIKLIFSVVESVLSKFFSDAWGAIKNVWNNATTFYRGVWDGIKGVFSNVGDWFGGKFSAAWKSVKDAFSGWGDFFSGLWTTIKNKFSDIGSSIGKAIGDSVKSGLNRVLSTVESTINKGVSLINSAISLANKLPGVNVGKVPEVRLPRLESGGVLKKGQIGLLEGNGAEAVVPLENNKKWIKKTARDIKESLKKEGATVATGGKSNSQNVNYTFNQYNNSPKALSRLEIYRQTKNQLAMAKGV